MYRFDNLEEILMCEECGRVVFVKTKKGTQGWIKKFFQCGGTKKKLFSWCSDKCFKNYYKDL
jgi:hypothetical protein